jgi:copper(I)-binding protein
MRMQHQPEGFAIPPGSTLQLLPGGKHVMLIGLAAPLAVGDTVTVTLSFAQAGEKVIQAPVVEIEGADAAPDSMEGHDHEGGN